MGSSTRHDKEGWMLNKSQRIGDSTTGLQILERDAGPLGKPQAYNGEKSWGLVTTNVTRGEG